MRRNPTKKVAVRSGVSGSWWASTKSSSVTKNKSAAAPNASVIASGGPVRFRKTLAPAAATSTNQTAKFGRHGQSQREQLNRQGEREEQPDLRAGGEGDAEQQAVDRQVDADGRQQAGRAGFRGWLPRCRRRPQDQQEGDAEREADGDVAPRVAADEVGQEFDGDDREDDAGREVEQCAVQPGAGRSDRGDHAADREGDDRERERAKGGNGERHRHRGWPGAYGAGGVAALPPSGTSVGAP